MIDETLSQKRDKRKEGRKEDFNKGASSTGIYLVENASIFIYINHLHETQVQVNQRPHHKISYTKSVGREISE